MRKLFTVLAAAGVALLGVSAANAGTLVSATFSTVANGIPITKTVTTADGLSGTSTATSAGVDAGSAFATNFNIPIPTTSPGYPTVSHVVVTLGNNGSLTATSGGAINLGGALTGNVAVYGLSLPAPLVNIPLSVGVAGTKFGSVLAGAVKLTIIGNPWTLGQAVATGLTASGSPVANLTTTGSFNLTAKGGGTVKLVTAGKVVVAGLANSTQGTPTVLTLTYVPEPGTLLLLGAGMVGLAALGRKKRA